MNHGTLPGEYNRVQPQKFTTEDAEVREEKQVLYKYSKRLRETPNRDSSHSA